MSVFDAIKTTIGLAKFSAADGGGPAVVLTTVEFTDGLGVFYTPDIADENLPNVVWSGPTNTVYPHATIPATYVLEGRIPTDQGGFDIRGMGFRDQDGDLVVVASVPLSYKPTLAENADRDQYYQTFFQHANASSVQVIIDPTVVMATQNWVTTQLDTYLDQAVKVASSPTFNDLTLRSSTTDVHLTLQNSSTGLGVDDGSDISVDNNGRLTILNRENSDLIISTGQTSIMTPPYLWMNPDHGIISVGAGYDGSKAWNQSASGFHFGSEGIIGSPDGSGGFPGIYRNAYYNASNQFALWSAGTAARLIPNLINDFVFQIAPSGAEDDVIAWSTALTVASNGSVVVGNPSGGKLGFGTVNAVAVYDDNTLLTDYVFDYYVSGEVHEQDLHQAQRFLQQPEILNIDKFSSHWLQTSSLPTMPTREEWNRKKHSLGELSQRIWETIEVQAIHIYELNQRLKTLEKTH